MPVCPNSRPIVHRPFIISDYRPGGDGALVADRPDVCPYRNPDDLPCVICLDHFRQRSTGPAFPLAVMRCLTHKRGFTLYPPGHVPYGRFAVAPVAFDGTEPTPVVENFVGTLFEAAVDAAQGKAWHRECEGGSNKWWPGQGRHLSTSIAIFGLTPDLEPAARQARAAALGVSMLLLVQSAVLIATAPGYRSRGQAAVAVLEQVARSGSLLGGVLAAGHQAGFWGPPLRWDRRARRLRPWAFRGDGTRPP